MYIPKTNSTNTLLLERLQQEALPDGYTVYTFEQTAGRGQQGNAWESEAGRNLLFSRVVRPAELHPSELFRLTQWVSVVITEVLRRYENGITIKWPNDIYWQEKKLCGILIESAFAGSRVDYAVVGVGLNVNQEVFVSDAPNPVSLSRILGGQTLDLDALMLEIDAAFVEMRPLLGEPTLLKQMYMERLFRREGMHSYMRREVSLEPTSVVRQSFENGITFLAAVKDVLSDGCLLLRLENGEQQAFHFKQIRFVL